MKHLYVCCTYNTEQLNTDCGRITRVSAIPLGREMQHILFARLEVAYLQKLVQEMVLAISRKASTQCVYPPKRSEEGHIPRRLCTSIQFFHPYPFRRYLHRRQRFFHFQEPNQSE